MVLDPTLHEWLHLLLRWLHIVAGIMWIGDSFLFMWLDRTLVPPDPPRDGVTGEVFMLHGGGYYQVEKRPFQPGKMPAVLHLFKWESLTTWISGFLLLVVVYYLGGAALLVDREVSHLSGAAAIAIGIGLLPVSWLVYDALWASPLGKRPALAAAVSVVLFGILAWGLSRTFSARTAYIHAGAVLGTLMVLNVWVRILPVQARLLAAVKRGENPDPAPGLAAKKRSTHNTYMTLPVVFIMVSNHFPTTYGNRWNWLALVLLSLAGGAVRHFMLDRSRRNAWLLALAGVDRAPSTARGSVERERSLGERPGPRSAGSRPGRGRIEPRVHRASRDPGLEAARAASRPGTSADDPFRREEGPKADPRGPFAPRRSACR